MLDITDGKEGLYVRVRQIKVDLDLGFVKPGRL